MLIDMHAHTTDKKLWGLHSPSATLEDLMQSAKQHQVGKTVLLATYFPFKGTGLPNQELLSRVGQNQQFLVFGSLDVMNNLEAGVKELRQLLQARMIVGIKLYPGYQDFQTIERVVPVLQLAREFTVPVMIHTGELHYCCPKEQRDSGQGKCGSICWIDRLQWQAEPQWLAQMPRRFPDVRFIFSHLGNPYFDQLIEVMRELPNVYTDISGQFLSGTSEDTAAYLAAICEKVEQFLAVPGVEDRLLFGTDFPIQSYASSIEIVDRLKVTERVKEKIRWQNAAKLLNLVEV